MGLFDKLFGKANSGKSDAGEIQCEKNTVYSPLKGTVVALETVNDEAFASGAMGPGVGIIPAEGKLYAPVDGEVTAVFPTNHALGISSADGLEILVHIGIDTVEMNGNGFTGHVKTGDKVKAGKLLVEFSIDKIKAAGYDPTTMVLVTNADEIGEGELTDVKLGEAAPLDKVFAIR